jgi:uncharacterized membrane protein YhhN
VILAFAVAAAIFAVADWFAVARRIKPLEYFCKPATIAALIAVAVAIHPHLASRRDAFVVALALSLVGDVFLMLPNDAFVPGLASFFLAHVAYIVGFRLAHPSSWALFAGVLFVSTYAGSFGVRVLRRAPKDLRVPVTAYVVVISVMVAFAIGTGPWLAAAGAIAFLVSDTLIAWNRFVRPLRWAPLAIIVTYHLAQAAFVASLRF